MYDDELEDERFVVDDVIDEVEDIEDTNGFIDLRKKDQYLKVNNKCPKCDCHTLEYQIYGYIKDVFCTNCPYNKTYNLE